MQYALVCDGVLDTYGRAVRFSNSRRTATVGRTKCSFENWCGMKDEKAPGLEKTKNVYTVARALTLALLVAFFALRHPSPAHIIAVALVALLTWLVVQRVLKRRQQRP